MFTKFKYQNSVKWLFLGELIMILALIKGLKKQLWVSNVPFVVSLVCTDTNVRDMLECL